MNQTFKITIRDIIKISLIGTILIMTLYWMMKPNQYNHEDNEVIYNHTGKTLYCLISPVTDNPYDEQMSIHVVEETIVNDKTFILYKYSVDQTSVSDNSLYWFDDWSKIDCNKIK